MSSFLIVYVLLVVFFFFNLLVLCSSKECFHRKARPIVIHNRTAQSGFAQYALVGVAVDQHGFHDSLHARSVVIRESQLLVGRAPWRVLIHTRADSFHHPVAHPSLVSHLFPLSCVSLAPHFEWAPALGFSFPLFPHHTLISFSFKGFFSRPEFSRSAPTSQAVGTQLLYVVMATDHLQKCCIHSCILADGGDAGGCWRLP